MESTGIPGKIQVSRSTYVFLYDKYIFSERELENVKGVGKMKAYIFESRKVPITETVNRVNDIQTKPLQKQTSDLQLTKSE